MASKIRSLRDARGMSGARLAEEMTRLGVPWDRSTVAKLETGRRGSVSVAELFALAIALGVTPVALLVDLKAKSAVLAPGVEVTPYEALLWVVGDRPLGPPPDLAVGEYRPPGLPWGEMQSDALLVQRIERVWGDVRHYHRLARPEPYGAATVELRASAARDLQEQVAFIRTLVHMASEAGIAVPAEITTFLTEEGGDG